MQTSKVIVIVGPTSSGKSALGRHIAQKLGGEVISADSRQVYKGMRIISRAEPGHMVGIADPRKRFSAGEYVKACSRVLQNIKIAIVVGGAGFYADALLGRMSLPEVAANPSLRKMLSKKSPRHLVALLTKLDPQSALRVDHHNKVRLVRAIEIAKALGSVPAPSPTVPYNALWLGLAEQKNVRRGVEERLRRGMVAEAQRLRRILSKKRYQELGFEFNLLAQYLDKKISKAKLIDNLTNGERKYAIRQMRWFKRNKDIHWIKNKTEGLLLAKKFVGGR